MRRRRQKNTLLPKMIGLAVLINAILLPILARFGAFKSIGGQRLTPVELVKLPPVPKPPAQTRKVARKPTPHPVHREASRPATTRRAPGPPPVHVVAVGPASGGSGGNGDSGITTSDNGAGGSPTPPVTPAGPPPQAPNNPTPPVMPTPPPVVTPAPPVTTPPPPAPHVPVLTAASPLQKPEPSIPDDLRDADLDANFQALFTVHPDGTASVKVVSGTGNPALDALALDAAHRWTFRPATKDGQPVESFLRLRIEFNVNS